MSTQPQRMVSVRTALSTGGAALAIFFLGVVAARATPGIAGGKTRDALSFAGTLRGVTGKQQLSFTFKKAGTAVPGCAPRVTVEADENGAFATELPLEGCPGALFDGADVTLDVGIGDVVVAQDQAINPVPYARYAERVGSPDCPLGYDRDASAGGVILCRRGPDDVVKVGSGPGAFWVDRYEASVWEKADGSGKQYGLAVELTPEFPQNGQGSKDVFALSKPGVQPSRYMTWFQANAACAGSGKELIGRREWFLAAWGTPDAAGCNTTTTQPLSTGIGTACASRWGAQDMIGNLWEWTDEWYPGVGTQGDPLAQHWPPGYGGDGTQNIISKVASPGGSEGGNEPGLPAAALRGGGWSHGTLAGVYALLLNSAPSFSAADFGFRCVIRR